MRNYRDNNLLKIELQSLNCICLNSVHCTRHVLNSVHRIRHVLNSVHRTRHVLNSVHPNNIN